MCVCVCVLNPSPSWYLDISPASKVGFFCVSMCVCVCVCVCVCIKVHFYVHACCERKKM